MKPVTGRSWQDRLALTLFGQIMRHNALAGMMRLGCPGIESSRDPWNMPVRRSLPSVRTVPFITGARAANTVSQNENNYYLLCQEKFTDEYH